MADREISLKRAAYLDAVRELYEAGVVNRSGGVSIQAVADEVDESYSLTAYHLRALAETGYLDPKVGFPDERGGQHRRGYRPRE